MTLIIRNISYLVRDPERIELNQDVLIDAGRIAAIGPRLAAPPDAENLDAAGCAVIPGLINAHTHLYQNFLKGVSAGLPLVPWCDQVLFPTVGALREAFAAGDRRPGYLWTAAAAIEMIRGGVTTCLNMDTTTRGIIEAWRDLGVRGVLAYTLTNRWVPAELRGEDQAMRRKVLDWVSEFHQPGGRIQVHLAPSTVFLCDDSLLDWVGQQADALDLGVQIHVSETAGEVQESLAETGRTPVERLVERGLLNERLSAVHCVHVTPAEIELLAAGKATAVHCPKSNMKLADGAAPVVDLLTEGVPVALGSDGCASNDLLDLWEEMRAAVLLARLAHHDANALTPEDAFRMATVSAARAWRIDAGQIDPGRLADLAVVSLAGAHLRPLHADQLINQLVFCGRASDVRDTIVDGVVLMRDRRLTRVDEAALLAEADAVEAPLYARRSAFAPAHESG
jgi:5-methylthioadenosine/S-adenosylhomocysteine deaminase